MIAAHKLQLNPVSPENLLEPIPLYRELRIREPVYWSEILQAWFITRHEDVMACFRDPRLRARRTRHFAYGLQEPGSTVQALEACQPVIRRRMEELVEGVKPQGCMELVREFSHWLPPLVGHTLLTDQLGNGIHDLLMHPEQLQKLREEPGLVRSAVEEILRYNPAMPFLDRLASESFELHGQLLREGSRVFLGMAAANRDPLVFPEPDRFDITRLSAKQGHLSFGCGPHPCLGAHLVRGGLETALEVLLQRLPGLRLDEDRPPRRKSPSLTFRGFESLHVRW